MFTTSCFFVLHFPACLLLLWQASPSYAAALSQHCTSKVPGLELSHLLGKGGFGSVYCGTWHGTAVAVKMIDVRWGFSCG